MATRTSYRAMMNYQRFLANDRDLSMMTSETAFELDESDVWNTAELDPSDLRRNHQQRPGSRLAKAKKPSSATGNRIVAATAGGTPSSLPVNIPDWSKILRDEYKQNRRREMEDVDGSDEDECGGGSWIPPHELLARTRIASFSVHEGIGRTLKGRDLSRVRDAVWEKIGFQD
ncbi:hypothetical protein Ancab_008300 [Ancistrocladus abbreviatus]